MSVHIDTLPPGVAATASSLPSVSNDIDPDTSSDSNGDSQGSGGGNDNSPPQSGMDLNDAAAHQQQQQGQQQHQGHPQQGQQQQQHHHHQQQQQHQMQQHHQQQLQQQQQQQLQHQHHQQQQQQHGLSQELNNAAGGQLPQQQQQQQQQHQSGVGGGGYPPSRRVTLGGSNSNRRNSLGYDIGMDSFFNRRPSGFGDLDILGRRDSLDSTTAVLDAAIRDLTRRRLSMTAGGADGLGMPGGPGAGMTDPMPSMGNMGSTGSIGNMSSMGNMSGGGIGAGGGSMGNMGNMNSIGGITNNINSMGNMGNMGTLNSNANANTNADSSSLLSPNQNSVERIAARQSQLQQQQRELEQRQKELEVQRQQILAGMEERRIAMQRMHENMQRNGGQHMPLNSPLSSSNHMMGGGASGGPNSMYMNRSSLASTLPPPSPGAGTRWIVCRICNKKAFASQEEALEHENICSAASGPGRHMSNATRRDSLGFGMGDFSGGGFPGMHDFGRSMSMQAERRLSGMGMGMGMGGHDQLGMFPSGPGSMGMQNSSGRRFSGNDDPVASPGTEVTLSTGPFAPMDKPLPLAMESDKDWLTPLHCFVRLHCVELFTASDKDVQTPSKGKRKPIQVDQVGIRCPHCHPDTGAKARERGSVYYPTTIASIYNATMNLLQRHLHSCTAVPPEIMQRYETLKGDDARSGTSKKYWIESALSLGLVDTANGIRFSAEKPPPPPSLTGPTQRPNTSSNSDEDFFSSKSNASGADLENDDPSGSGEGYSSVARRPSSPSDAGDGSGTGDLARSAVKPDPQPTPLVTPEDEPYSTKFSYCLLSQMQPCIFTEADRLGKRKGLPPGFPGLACRHCFGGYGSGRFFPSSIKTLSDTSKTLNVLHNHMMRCRKCPVDVRESLATLRATHDEERAKMKFGSQKAFFTRVWDRLHKDDDFGVDYRSGNGNKRKFSAGPGNPPPGVAHSHQHPHAHAPHLYQSHPHPGMMGAPMSMGGMSAGRMPMPSGMYGGGHPHNMMDSMRMPPQARMPMDHERLGMMDMDPPQGMQRGGDTKRRRES